MTARQRQMPSSFLVLVPLVQLTAIHALCTCQQSTRSAHSLCNTAACALTPGTMLAPLFRGIFQSLVQFLFSSSGSSSPAYTIAASADCVAMPAVLLVCLVERCLTCCAVTAATLVICPTTPLFVSCQTPSMTRSCPSGRYGVLPAVQQSTAVPTCTTLQNLCRLQRWSGPTGRCSSAGCIWAACGRCHHP